MSRRQVTRRQFAQSAGGIAAVAFTPYWLTSRLVAQESKNDRPLMALIGCGGQGRGDAQRARRKGADFVAVCDPDRGHADQARHELGDKAEVYEDYRKLLERKDVEAVVIGTPDHWHTAIALAALEAGKHVYCEKPLTLTIDEGRQLVAAVKKYGRAFQVGTQQRGDQVDKFARAVATVRSGQLGRLRKVTVHLPLSTSEGGPFPARPIPAGLNWDLWLGQAPQVDYCPERCHYQFRWWYEYSGGVLTDWGAHHMDIALWGMNLERSGPTSIDGSQTKLPSIPGGYNTPKHPIVRYTFPGEIELDIVAEYEGVTFVGEQGKLFVNRGRVTGKAIEQQDQDAPLKEKTMQQAIALFQGNTAQLGDHMGNFFEAFRAGKHPISDVESQHRAVSACHLGNISIRLQRKLQWDPAREDFVGDSQASAMRRREQRAGYQIRPLV